MALKRKYMIINGVEKVLIYDPETDTLAETLRRHGYLGVKIGCGTGQCGACNVILNGELMRSCILKMEKVEEWSSIVTIEGLGMPGHLHPLQQAWIYHGGAQCGFCTPGFIVSAKALLDKNPNPTRQEVRQWFQNHRNVCRCTGYKPLVDAVMDAAAVMRGDKSVDDIIFRQEEGKELYNSRSPRPTALAKVLGQMEYGDDLRHHMPEGTLHAAIIQPKACSHAKILNIDMEEAYEMPGVVKIVTARDVKGTNRITEPIFHPSCTVKGNECPIFCDKTIFRYGDIVGVVVADSDAHARAAAKKVKVELEPLPEYMNYLDAVKPGAESIHENSPTNIYLQQPLIKGEDTRKVIKESYCSVDGSFYSQRQPHMTVEGEVLESYYDEEGRVVVHCKSMGLMWGLLSIAEGLGLSPDRLRLIQNPSGASFGWSTMANGPAMIAAAMMAVNQPVTATLSYEEFMHFSGKRSANYINGRLACDDAGRLTGLEFDTGCDHGPYFSNVMPELGALVSFMGYPYNIPNIRGLGRMAITNHTFATAFRGLGSPQCYSAFEGLIDELARKMKMDPLEFRYINAARPGDLNSNNRPYPEPSIAELIDAMRPAYEQAKRDIEGRDTEDKAYGIGLACGGYVSNLGMIDKSEVALELNPDGSITHYNTWEDVGQGGDIGALELVEKALKPLGIKPSQIRCVTNDTVRCPDSGIAAGSRSHFMNGNAIIDAAEKLMNAMRKPDGSFRSYEEMIAEKLPVKYIGKHETAGKECEFMNPMTGEGSLANCMNYGCFMSLVEVDKHTGKARVLRYVISADVGVIGNRLAVEGQAYGGMAQTVGYALKEEYDNLKKGGSMLGAGIPYIEDIPDDVQLIFKENPRKYGPNGSSGCGELFLTAGHMSVLNAIRDAVGVRVYDMPARPEKIKAAMEARAQGKDNKPEKYYLGPDMFDIFEELSHMAPPQH